MPAGYSSKCKTCKSPYRLQIEAWHGDGLSPETIELKLKGLGESISWRAIHNHFQAHYDVQGAVREMYLRSQAALQETAEKCVSEIQMLDGIAQEKYGLHQKLGRILTNQISELEDAKEVVELPKLPKPYVDLFIGCASEIRQTLKTKQELLGDDPESRKANSITELVLFAAGSTISEEDSS